MDTSKWWSGGRRSVPIPGPGGDADPVWWLLGGCREPAARADRPAGIRRGPTPIERSGQAHLEALMEPPGVECECRRRIQEAPQESVHEEGDRAEPGWNRSGRLEDPGSKAGKVDLDLLGPRPKAAQERPGRRVMGHVTANAVEGIEESRPVEEGLEEQGEDRGAVLPSRQAEIWEERYGLALAGAEETLDGDGSRIFGVRKQG